MIKTETGIHDFVTSNTGIHWTSMSDRPSGIPHDVGINYYLGRGYLEYKNSWVLPFELPWYTRWLLGLIKRLGVSGFWRKR